MPCPVDADGRYTAAVPDFQGKGVKEADNDICAALKAAGRLVRLICPAWKSGLWPCRPSHPGTPTLSSPFQVRFICPA